MLIEEIMAAIYKRFEKSSDTPDSTSEDFIVRLEFVNASIGKWEHEVGMEWKELYDVLSGTLVDGVYDDNTGVGTLENFKRPAGFLKVGTDKYEYVRPERVEIEQRTNVNKKIYTVLGSTGAFTIQVYPEVSGAFTINYRKTATTYSTGEETTPIEMSDPGFIIHDVLSQLYLDDDNGTQASVEQQIAGAKMNAMKLANETPPFYQPQSEVSEKAFGFGT